MTDTLYILWTTDNEITAEKMVFMYAKNALINKWWDKVTVVIWGASSVLAAHNTKIKECIADAKHEGVNISACKACADQLNTTPYLEQQDIELRYWGEPITKLIKLNSKILTV